MKETLLVIHRCLERLDFCRAVQVLNSVMNSESATTLSFLIGPYLLLTACESSYYSMTFLEEQEMLQTALNDYHRVASTEREVRPFDSQLKIEDTSQLYHLYGKILRDFEDVIAVLDTVSSYEEDTQESAEAKFVSTLLTQMRLVLVARRKLISSLSNWRQKRYSKLEKIGRFPYSGTTTSRGICFFTLFGSNERQYCDRVGNVESTLRYST
eukprot:TRINITY_DN13706_c0_g1_i5.p2 TRINITY_DN13706_c0_g1~~TRINITY_DN13706_c0_g1_i5.p2  ORF type:complete len:212 (-),score=32.25 TRINITY_DN13706_c0_g1_i5:870-1505(-)